MVTFSSNRAPAHVSPLKSLPKAFADTVTVSASASSLTKGESLRDTACNLKALQADIIIMRHSASGAPNYLSKVVDIPVINAGDGSHAHPTQALLDAFTLIDKLGPLDGKKITILNDILFSRVARSNIICLQKLGAEVPSPAPAPSSPKASVRWASKSAMTFSPP